jgi:hypothetical protein
MNDEERVDEYLLEGPPACPLHPTTVQHLDATKPFHEMTQKEHFQIALRIPRGVFSANAATHRVRDR